MHLRVCAFKHNISLLARYISIANRLTKGFFDDSMSVFEKYQLF